MKCKVVKDNLFVGSTEVDLSKYGLDDLEKEINETTITINEDDILDIEVAGCNCDMFDISRRKNCTDIWIVDECSMGFSFQGIL